MARHGTARRRHGVAPAQPSTVPVPVPVLVLVPVLVPVLYQLELDRLAQYGTYTVLVPYLYCTRTILVPPSTNLQ